MFLVFIIKLAYAMICKPVNKEELFNLHHASAQNVVEHILVFLNTAVGT